MIGTSEIQDFRLLFKGSKTGSYLTIEPAEGFNVPVGVWSVSPEDELRLDRYEGFPTFYYKKEMTLPIRGIKSGRIRHRKVFVYIMHEDRPFGVPSPFYLRGCAEGYMTFDFDLDILNEAFLYSRQEAKK